MFYILDSLGYIEEVSTHYIERDNKTCAEYTGAVPSGYDTLDDWGLNANIRAYKIDNGNLTYDADRDAALTEQWAKVGRIEDYSTSEQVIGTWIDGKPLYRKTYNLGTLPETFNVIDTIPVDTLVRAYGSAKAGNGVRQILPIRYPDGSACFLYEGSTHIAVEGAATPFYWDMIWTIEYTKTTD